MEKTAGWAEKPKRKRWPRTVWIKRVREFRDSGLSAEAFAAKKSIELRTLKSWIRVLRMEGEAPARGNPPAFLPVSVLHAGRPPEPLAAMMVEVDLANGRRVRLHVRPDADFRRVAELVDAVGGGHRC